MELSYSSKKLQKKLKDERLIHKNYGNRANNLVMRIAELEAAVTLANIPNIPPPRRHKLKGGYNNQWGIDVTKNYRIIIEPVGEYNEEDLSTIISIKIIDIVDYH